MEPPDLQAVTRWGKVQAWWLHHPDVEADHFCVLAALSTYADEDGCCEPSQATLARWLGRSRPWVNRVIADLVEMEILTKEARTRRNGGTTSCRYRLRMAVPSEESRRATTAAPVTPLTSPVTNPDTPCQGDDTTQLDIEQIQKPALSGRPRVDQQDHDAGQPVEVLAADWRPSIATVNRALSLYPDADLTEHTALFVSRCRGKGYRIRPGNADDLWLSWLIEDRRRPGRPKRTAETGQASAASRRGSQDMRFGRFAAWSLAAAAPAVSVTRS